MTTNSSVVERRIGEIATRMGGTVNVMVPE